MEPEYPECSVVDWMEYNGIRTKFWHFLMPAEFQCESKDSLCSVNPPLGSDTAEFQIVGGGGARRGCAGRIR